MIRFVLPALALLATAAPAQEIAPTPPPAPAPVEAPVPKPATVRVTLTTSLGPIVIEVEKEGAPISSKNFLRYVDEKRFDGINFYRAVKVQDGFGLVQAGTRNDPKRTLPPIPHEPTTVTGLSHVDGSVSFARAAPGSATSDFFITVGAMPTMDADPSATGDNLGFAVFGRIVEGMDVIRQIMEAPKSPTAGEGAMKGQMLEPPVRIVTAKRVE